MVGIELQMINTTIFFLYLKVRRHGNQFSGKITYPLHLSFCYFETEWDIATSICALTAYMLIMPLYRMNIS